MKAVIAAIAAFAVAAVSAQSTNIVSITSPLQGNVYTAGNNVTISWIEPQVQTIPKITLAQGNPNALQPILDVAENVDASSSPYIWTIPPDTPAGNDYAFILGVSPNVSYAGQFTINAADGSSSNETTASQTASSSTTASSTSTTNAASTQGVASDAAIASTPVSTPTGDSKPAGSASSASTSSTSATTPSPSNAGLQLTANSASVLAVAGIAIAALV